MPSASTQLLQPVPHSLGFCAGWNDEDGSVDLENSDLDVTEAGDAMFAQRCFQGAFVQPLATKATQGQRRPRATLGSA
jgi:hypothetical protein